MQKWIQPPACLDHSCMCSNCYLFRQTVLQKMRERHRLFFGLRLVSKELQYPAIETKIEQHFGKFIHQIKVRRPIGRQERWSEQAGGWINFCVKRPRTFQIFKCEIKKSKTYSGWCPFQGLSNGTLRSNLARWYLYEETNVNLQSLNLPPGLHLFKGCSHFLDGDKGNVPRKKIAMSPNPCTEVSQLPVSRVVLWTTPIVSWALIYGLLFHELWFSNCYFMIYNGTLIWCFMSSVMA